jgi:iron complex outermembrane recepter protein
MSSPSTFQRTLLSIAVIGACGISQNVIAADDTQNILNTAPVVVTATRVKTNSFDLPISIDVVDAETISDSRLQANLSEIAPRIPGVVINNRNNSAQELAISSRGFGARSLFGVKGIRVYADGIPLTTPDGQGQLGALSLDTAGQIEFMRGPFSALYGNSSGGVIQAITRDGAKDTTLSAGISFGSYNTRRETLTLEGQSGDLNYIINTSEIDSNGYRDHSEYKKENFNSKLTYQSSEDTKITLIANYLNQPYTQDPQSLNSKQFRLDPQQTPASSTTANTRVTRDQTFSGITIDHNLSESQSIRLMTYYGQRNNLQYLTTSVSGYSRDFGGMDARWTLKDNLWNRPFSLTAGLNYDSMADDRQRWNNGNGITGNGFKGTLLRNEVQKAHNVDQFVQATFEPTDNWMLIAGLRHSVITMNVEDKFLSDGINSTGSLEYSNTSPALGATFKVNPTLNLYANYGKGFETPTWAEMTYSDTSGNGPNLSMQPSKTKNYEIGAKAFITDNTRVNLALFKVNAINEIVVAGTLNSITAYKSVADTERKGLELSIDSRLPYNFKFYGAYTLMDAAFTNRFCGATSCTTPSAYVNAGNKIPGTYTSTTYSELSWKYPAYGFSTAIEAIYFSATNAFDTNLATTGATGTDQKANAYTLLNLRAGLTQNVGNWRVTEYARVDNLTDVSYVSTVKVNSSTPFEPGVTRNYTVGINTSYTFK